MGAAAPDKERPVDGLASSFLLVVPSLDKSPYAPLA